jgi:hypothetical protein
MGAAEPAPGFLATVVDLAGAGLSRRGLGEGPMLDPIHERLARRRGPADEAWGLRASGGIEALVQAVAIEPS